MTHVPPCLHGEGEHDRKAEALLTRPHITMTSTMAVPGILRGLLPIFIVFCGGVYLLFGLDYLLLGGCTATSG